MLFLQIDIQGALFPSFSSSSLYITIPSSKGIKEVLLSKNMRYKSSKIVKFKYGKPCNKETQFAFVCMQDAVSPNDNPSS